jgi:hypothetical protein
MYEWLEAATERLSEGVGDDADRYRFREGEIDLILDLAGVAAHEGGHKTNAPLLSYLVGLAHGRHPDATLAQLTAIAAGEKGPAGS